MRNEFIPFLFAKKLFKMVKKVEAFLVGNAGEGIIWVFSFQVNDQFCEFMVFSKLCDRVRKSLPANYGREITVRFAMSIERRVRLRKQSIVQSKY